MPHFQHDDITFHYRESGQGVPSSTLRSPALRRMRLVRCAGSSRTGGRRKPSRSWSVFRATPPATTAGWLPAAAAPSSAATTVNRFIGQKPGNLAISIPELEFMSREIWKPSPEGAVPARGSGWSVARTLHRDRDGRSIPGGAVILAAEQDTRNWIPRDGPRAKVWAIGSNSRSIRRSSRLCGGYSQTKRFSPSSFEAHSDPTSCQAANVLVPM